MSDVDLNPYTPKDPERVGWVTGLLTLLISLALFTAGATLLWICGWIVWASVFGV